MWHNFLIGLVLFGPVFAIALAAAVHADFCNGGDI
jgi:hypothetical protein